MKIALAFLWLSMTLFAQEQEPFDLECGRIPAWGKQHDAKSYKVLLSIRKNNWCVDSIPQLRDALAKRGDKIAQHDVVCDVMASSLNEPQNDLTYIGGRFAVRLALKMAKEVKGERHGGVDGDVVVTYSPPVLAIHTLRMLLPKGPRTGFSSDFPEEAEVQRVVRAWEKYIGTHQAELAKMKPTGEGVVLARCDYP